MGDYVGYDDALHGDDGLDGDEFVGADDAEILGAVKRAMRRPQQARKPQLMAASAPPKKLRGYLGMGTAVFTSVTGTLLSVTVEPQRSFRPERLIVDRTDGTATTADVAARINAIFIGDQPQSPSVEQPAPIAMFRADATVSGIDFDKAIPGQKITIQLSISRALVVGETVTVSSGFYGDMLR